MDNQRTLLFAALAFIAVLIWQAWQEDYVLPQQMTTQVAATESKVAPDVPDVKAKSNQILPSSSEGADNVNIEGGTISVSTDVYELQIDKIGGSLIGLTLTDYPEEKGQEKKNTALA
jgi:membrane protein insertase, YidC/Oxa1 family, N-terminal domain